MAQPQLQDLLEAGVHFGHQTRRWNPKMRRFIFAERSGIYIIDLQKTLRQIQKAQELLRSVVLKGDGVLFVCTKKQLKAIVQVEAQTAGAFYVTERWLGGMLTNFQTLKKQIRRLRELEQGAADGDFENYTKKEKLLFERERVKLSRNLEGIKQLSRLPGALFVVDAKKEKIAVAEANKLGIPVFAVVDTNCSPEGIDYVIPGNDDALRAVRLFASRIADAVLEGQQMLTEGGATVEATEEGEPASHAAEAEAPGEEPAEGSAESTEAEEPTEAQSTETMQSTEPAEETSEPENAEVVGAT